MRYSIFFQFFFSDATLLKPTPKSPPNGDNPGSAPATYIKLYIYTFVVLGRKCTEIDSNTQIEVRIRVWNLVSRF